ncbi:H/ACA ribonucleoprotein complex non-core subunit NAF1, partial [Stegodyphus mimosarum]
MESSSEFNSSEINACDTPLTSEKTSVSVELGSDSLQPEKNNFSDSSYCSITPVPSNNIDSKNAGLSNAEICISLPNPAYEGQSQSSEHMPKQLSSDHSLEASKDPCLAKAEELAATTEILNAKEFSNISGAEGIEASTGEKVREALDSKFTADDGAEVSKADFGEQSSVDVSVAQCEHSQTSIKLNGNSHQSESDLCMDAEDEIEVLEEPEKISQCNIIVSTLHPEYSVEISSQCNGISYRCESDSWTEDESSSSDDSSSDSSDSFLDKMHENQMPARIPNIKTKGELDLDDLPPIEDLQISVSEKEMQKIGVVHAVVDKLVVIKAVKDMQPLDLDSVLFVSAGKPLGRIFDVFGQVVDPFYCVRFNTSEDIKDKGIAIDDDVFFAPEKTDITSYVFVEQLKNQKGSDASWKDNNEPPPEHIDYSDDEQENAAKKKRRAKGRDRGSDEVFVLPRKIPALGSDNPVFIPPPYPSAGIRHNVFSRHSNTMPFNSNVQPNSPCVSISRPSPHMFLSSPNFSSMPPNYHSVPSPCFSPRFSPSFSPVPTAQNSFQVHSPLPSPTPFHLQQRFVSYQSQNALRPPLQPNYQPPQFGQFSGLGSPSPALQSPIPYNSHVLRPVSHLPGMSPNTNYFAPNICSPPPSLSGPMPINSQWFQNQSVRIPHSHNVPPNTPLSIQIPQQLASPPPSLLAISFPSGQPLNNAAQQRFRAPHLPPNFQ